jgi:hypothetical protein
MDGRSPRPRQRQSFSTRPHALWTRPEGRRNQAPPSNGSFETYVTSYHPEPRDAYPPPNSKLSGRYRIVTVKRGCRIQARPLGLAGVPESKSISEGLRPTQWTPVISLYPNPRTVTSS